jgi:hypothetical protein
MVRKSLEGRIEALEKGSTQQTGCHECRLMPTKVRVLYPEDESADASSSPGSESSCPRCGSPIREAIIKVLYDKDEVYEFYGRPYTMREGRELAICRALEKHGHSTKEIAELIPEYLALFETADAKGEG